MGVHVYWVLFFITDNRIPYMGVQGVQVFWVLFFKTDNRIPYMGVQGGVLGFIFYNGQPRNPYMGVQVYWVLFFITDKPIRASPGRNTDEDGMVRRYYKQFSTLHMVHQKRGGDAPGATD